MPRLTEHERNNCVRLLNEGLPERDVARIYNVSNGTINYLRQHFRATGNVAYLHRGGKPRGIEGRVARTLLREVRRRRTSSSRILNEDLRRQTGVLVSNRTVRRKLNESNLR